MSFPAPPAPAFATDQAATLEEFLRYEDVTQDGRLIALAVPPALGGFWRAVLGRDPGTRHATAAGVIPILTRLTIATQDRQIRVDRKIEARSGYQLAHAADGRLFLNVWNEVHGVPRGEPAGARVLAGQVFAEHTFTRPFAPRGERRVTRFEVEGYPAIPDAVHPALDPASAGDKPDDALWASGLVEDRVEIPMTLDHTDSNQHVNSLVYLRSFLEAAARQLAAYDAPLAVRASAIDIAYRKPCFAGDRIRAHVRLFARTNGQFGAAGFLTTGDRPHCFVRCLFGQ